MYVGAENSGSYIPMRTSTAPFVGPQTGRSSEVAVGGEQAKEPHSLGMLWIHLVWRCAPQFHAKWTLARDSHPIIRIQDFERRSLLALGHVTVH